MTRTGTGLIAANAIVVSAVMAIFRWQWTRLQQHLGQHHNVDAGLSQKKLKRKVGAGTSEIIETDISDEENIENQPVATQCE